MANTSEGNTLPYDITPALSDSDNAPSAIPTKASFIGVKLSFEVVNAKTMPIIKAPRQDNKNKERLPVGTIPAIAKDIKNTAPPPTPNRFGSPKGDLVEVCIKSPPNPKHAPDMIAESKRGIRTCHIMVEIIPSSLFINPLNNSDNGASRLPRNIPANNDVLVRNIPSIKNLK